MDEKIQEEMSRVQEKLGETDPNSEEYKALVSRLRELDELYRSMRGEDAKTLEVQVQRDIEEQKLEVMQNEAEIDRKENKFNLLWKALGIAGLMFFSRILNASEIPNRIDEKFVDRWLRKD